MSQRDGLRADEVVLNGGIPTRPRRVVRPWCVALGPDPAAVRDSNPDGPSNGPGWMRARWMGFRIQNAHGLQAGDLLSVNWSESERGCQRFFTYVISMSGWGQTFPSQ